MSSTVDPTDLIGLSEAAEAQALRDEATARLAADDLRWLMGHRQGRRIAARVLEKAHVHHVSFNTNASVTAFREGERNVGLWLQGEVLDACPDSYMQMLKEQKQ
jgi:hypothetical protein